MEEIRLFDSEFKFASIVWDNEPVGSGELVRLCAEKLGWKKSTTYTVLKKLCERGIMKNEKSTVVSIIKKENVQKAESEAVMSKAFNGSLPTFIASFLGGKTISAKEAEEIKRMIDEHEEVQA